MYIYTQYHKIDSELEKIWEKVVIAQFEVLSQYSSGRSEKDREKLQSGLKSGTS
jgi:hypothetical protein